MISTSPFGTLGFIASFRAANLYHGNHDIKYKPGKIVSNNWEIYTCTPYADTARIILQKHGKFTIKKLNSSLLS